MIPAFFALPRWVHIAIAVALALALLAGIHACVRADAAADERARQERLNAEAQARADRINAEAQANAAERRAEDVINISNAQEVRDEAIRTGPDPRVALACRRLRAAGTPDDRLPEPCRSAR